MQKIKETIRLEFLGTGSAFNHTLHNCSALVSGLPRHSTLLLDCGYDVPSLLGTRMKEVNYIWISHVHSDHVGGLEELAWMCKFLYKTRPILWAEHNVMMELRQYLTPLLGKFKGPKTHGDFLSIFFNPVTYRYMQFFSGEFYGADNSRGVVAENYISQHVETKPSTALGFSVYDDEQKTREPVFLYTGDMAVAKEGSDNRAALEEYPSIFHDMSVGDLGENGVHTSIDNMLSHYPEEWRRKITGMHYETGAEEARTAAVNGGLRGAAVPGQIFNF